MGTGQRKDDTAEEQKSERWVSVVHLIFDGFSVLDIGYAVCTVKDWIEDFLYFYVISFFNIFVLELDLYSFTAYDALSYIGHQTEYTSTHFCH